MHIHEYCSANAQTHALLQTGPTLSTLQTHAYIFISLASLTHTPTETHILAPREWFCNANELPREPLSRLGEATWQRAVWIRGFSNHCVASAPSWHGGRGSRVFCHGPTQLEFIQHTVQWQRNWQPEANYVRSRNSGWNTEGVRMYGSISVCVHF